MQPAIICVTVMGVDRGRLFQRHLSSSNVQRHMRCQTCRRDLFFYIRCLPLLPPDQAAVRHKPMDRIGGGHAMQQVVVRNAFHFL